MVASCHRRSGDYALAFEIYRAIHSDFPENIECLRYLVHICDDLGKKDQSHDYVVKLRAVERAMESGEAGGGGGAANTFDPSQGMQMQQPQMQQQRMAQPNYGGGGYTDISDAGGGGGGGNAAYNEEFERQQVQAAATSNKPVPHKIVKKGGADQDDQFDDLGDLGDDLLPP